MNTLSKRRCGRCGVWKLPDEFGYKAKGGRQGYCRICQTAYQREHYLKNQEKYVASALRQKALKKAILQEAKNRPCLDCGMIYPPYVMDFDHREGEDKKFNISTVNRDCWINIAQLQAEISKCDVVCANCHRIRTHQRRHRAAQVVND